MPCARVALVLEASAAGPWAVLLTENETARVSRPDQQRFTVDALTLFTYRVCAACKSTRGQIGANTRCCRVVVSFGCTLCYQPQHAGEWSMSAVGHAHWQNITNAALHGVHSHGAAWLARRVLKEQTAFRNEQQATRLEPTRLMTCQGQPGRIMKQAGWMHVKPAGTAVMPTQALPPTPALPHAPCHAVAGSAASVGS